MTISTYQNPNMVGEYDSWKTTTKGMELMEKTGSLQWQDSVAYNMAGLSLEREALVNEQLKADIANKAAMAGLASQYLDAWNGMLASSNNMLNSAAQTISGLLGEAGSLSSSSSAGWAKIDAAIGDINTAVSDYQSKYGGLENAAIDTAIFELGASKTLTQQLLDLSKPDVEGASTRAKADVTSEASAARAKMADQLVALGVDPTSGTGQTMMRDSMDTEALNKVLASNTARVDELNRAAGLTVAGLNAINPAETAGIATNIATGQRELMNDKNNLLIAGMNAQNQELQSKGELASALARVASATTANASQMGDFGAALLGASMG